MLVCAQLARADFVAASGPEPSHGELWVFGYRFADVAARVHLFATLQGDVEGMAQEPMHLFARLSGTPDSPGLVLGLDRGGACPGVAFRVEPRCASRRSGTYASGSR